MKFARGQGERSCDKIRSGGGPIIAKSNFFFCDSEDFKHAKKKQEEEEREMMRKFASREDVDLNLLEEEYKRGGHRDEDEWMFETFDTRARRGRSDSRRCIR